MNVEKPEKDRQPHTLSLKERRQLEVRGVTDAISFDEETVELATVAGSLTVEGRELHIRVLDLAEGIVTVEGTVSALIYSDREPAEKQTRSGWLGKLIR